MRGDLNVVLVILAAWGGAVTGDNISYGIGKWAGERTVRRLFRHEKAQRGFDWAEQQLEDRGSYIIVVARFIPFGRTAVTFTAGYTRGLPWHRFFRYDVVAGGLWAVYATMLGYIGGKQFEEQPWKGVMRRPRDRLCGRVRRRVGSAPPRQEAGDGALSAGRRRRLATTQPGVVTVRSLDANPRHRGDRVPRLGVAASAPPERPAIGSRCSTVPPCASCSPSSVPTS